MQKTHRPLSCRRALLAASLSIVTPAFAANISWQAPATVTSDGAISMNGFLVHAGNFRSSGDLTVTVGATDTLFKNRPSQNALGGLLAGEEARVIQGAGGKQTNSQLFNNAGTTVSPNFDAVLDGSAWENGDAGPAPGLTDTILRVTGVAGAALTQGQSYQIQVFYSDDRSGLTGRGQRYHDGNGNYSTAVLAGDSTGVIGTFTADAAGYQDIHVQNTTGGSNFPVAVNAYVLRVVSNEDTDGDELPNLWETANSLNPANATGVDGKLGDPDSDTYSNFAEYTAGSNPQLASSVPGDVDGDSLPDTWEMQYFNALSFSGLDDPDNDFVFNIDEKTAGTNPNNRLDAPDDDGVGGAGDGMGDAWESYYFNEIGIAATPGGDQDGDGISNLNEWLADTDPSDLWDPYTGVTTIAWNAPVTVTSNSDILASGTLVHAGNFRSDNADVTVTAGSGSILFKNRLSQDAMGTLPLGEEARVIAGSGGRQVNGQLFDATGTTVSAEFESVLDGSAWENTDPGPAPGATDMILRVAGAGGEPLVAGQQYKIQLFCSDDRPTSATRGQLFHDNKGHESAPFLASSSSALVGTFTATSAGVMDILIRNTTGEGNFPVSINAYVLRTVSAGDSDSDGMPDTWESANGLNPNSNDAAGDLDGDGLDNFGEFAFKGSANNGTSRGVNSSALLDTNANGQKELILTIAVRTGANFTGGPDGTQVATVDGVAYKVRGSLDLASFTSAVAHVGTTASDDPDYELHTFRLAASEGLPGQGFLQASALVAP